MQLLVENAFSVSNVCGVSMVWRSVTLEEKENFEVSMVLWSAVVSIFIHGHVDAPAALEVCFMTLQVSGRCRCHCTNNTCIHKW